MQSLSFLLSRIVDFLDGENDIFGGDDNAHAVSVGVILTTFLYYIGYFLFARYVRRKTVLRNPFIEQVAFYNKSISAAQLMSKYAGNLSASSTMAALSVTMVLLSVASLFQVKLKPYDHFVAKIVCTLMTVASIGLLFAHELYDAIINPVFDPERRFALRKMGADFQAMGLILFIMSMLLAISTVSTLATILSSVVCCFVMTRYIEARLIDRVQYNEQLLKIVTFHQNLLSNE